MTESTQSVVFGVVIVFPFITQCSHNQNSKSVFNMAHSGYSYNRFVSVWPPCAAMVTSLIVHRVWTWHLPRCAQLVWLLKVQEKKAHWLKTENVLITIKWLQTYCRYLKEPPGYKLWRLEYKMSKLPLFFFTVVSLSSQRVTICQKVVTKFAEVVKIQIRILSEGLFHISQMIARLVLFYRLYLSLYPSHRAQGSAQSGASVNLCDIPRKTKSLHVV